MVTENSEGEDSECKEVAAIVRASKEAGQEVVAVLCSPVSQGRMQQSSGGVGQPARATMLDGLG